MPLRPHNAPAVFINEIDKSPYSPAMTGTNCYVMGFANKGEAYQPMSFTSKSAWLSYYGEPDNEAEKYFYNACSEVITQNGRLTCARLPYDNESFEKMVGFKYSVTPSQTLSSIANKAKVGEAAYDYHDISDVDATIDNVAVIDGADSPYLMELSEVDEYRTNEKKPAINSIIIVDTTCGSYKKILEDKRKGKDREILGVVPVITTAANGLYAQKLIKVSNENVKYYESIGRCVTQGDENGGISGYTFEDLSSLYDKRGEDGNFANLSTLAPNSDLTRQLNTIYKGFSLVVPQDTITTIADMYAVVNGLINGEGIELSAPISSETGDFNIGNDTSSMAEIVEAHNDLVDNLLSTIEANATLSVFVPTVQELTVDVDTELISDIMDKSARLNSFATNNITVKAIDGDDSIPNTVSLEANTFFSTIKYNTETEQFDRDVLKKIGVVVYRVYLDAANGNKISFEPVEAFVGSLNANDKDPNTGVTTFIDTIVNSQSQYINVFSNVWSRRADKAEYDKLDMYIAKPCDLQPNLGFYAEQVEEDISIDMSIYQGISKCFEKVSDIIERDIDIIPDAGVSNIASYLKAIFGNKGKYDIGITDADGNSMLGMWKADSNNDAIKTWKTVIQKYDSFCKLTRKDCMFIADGPRPMVLQGNKKIVRPSKPSNNVDVNILPNVKFITGLNTNYGAGYCNWFEIADEYTGDFFWLPPSIKAMGSYIYTDLNFDYWEAPAGLTRGLIAATDVSFSPTLMQASTIYDSCWNYAINYPNDGIVLEGQRTFQTAPSALDRVNVRRLLLRLERSAFKTARRYIYELNTAYTRQRLSDAIEVYLREAKVGGGLYDYKIVCDESNNTPDTIDRNELHVSIGLKPTKVAEYIIIDFIVASTGASWDEVM